MTATTSLSPIRLVRWSLSVAVLLCAMALAPGSALAQSSGGDSGPSPEKLKQLKSTFKEGLQAAKAGNHSQAYARLEEALQLAKDTEQSGAQGQIQGYLQKLPKNWGNTAIEDKDWSSALQHFEKGTTHAEDDAYMHYGKGLALLNMDSTSTGLQSMQRAIEVGNRTGNTRVAGLATQRIRDEFLARASKALNAQDPTVAQANQALSALDEMRQYVDPNAKSLYYRARALFEKGEHAQAIETARRGLDMHQGSRTDAAKYYFIIGESQLRTGNKQQACQTFQNATYGDYKARSEHYLENECD